MADFYCVVVIASLIVGYILGKWRVPPEYCGEVIISEDSETCTFSLDIPADDIPHYRELVFRVVEQKEDR